MKNLVVAFLLFPLACFGQARYFTRASSQGYHTSAAPVTFYPITLAAWVKCNSLAANGTAISICSTSTGNRTQLLFQNTGTFQTQSGPGALYGPTAVTVSAGVWYHIVAICTVSGTALTITQYTNGVVTGAAGTGTDAGSDPLWNTFAIGERHNGTSWGTFWEGEVQDACIWAAALDTNEIFSLSTGCSPALIRPGALRGWIKTGERVYDRASGLALTADGSPTIATNSPPKLWGVR